MTVREYWLVNNKGTVLDIAQRFMGTFTLHIVEAFCSADSVNTKKLLNTFPFEFKEIYLVHRRLEEKGD